MLESRWSVLSDTGDVTDNQSGVIFVAGREVSW